MVRIMELRGYDEAGKVLVGYAGNSVDEKPTIGLVTGSEFTEVDTGIKFLFDEESNAWCAQNSGNGKTSIVGATVTLGSAVTYDGTEKTQSVSSVKIGATTLTENTDYVVTGNKATEIGDYTLRIVGKGSYVGYVDKAWSIGKGTGSISASPDTLSLTEGGEAGASTLTVTGDGVITAVSSADDVATVAVEGTTATVTPVGDGSATITITLAGSDHYTGDTATIGVTVAAAETPAENDG